MGLDLIELIPRDQESGHEQFGRADTGALSNWRRATWARRSFTISFDRTVTAIITPD